MSDFEFNWKITCNWHSKFTVHLSNLITVRFLLFVKPQFRTDAQTVLHLIQCTHGYVWSWTVAHFRRSWGGCEWFDRRLKCFREVSLCFQLQLNTLGFLSVLRDRNLRDWGQHVKLYLENCLRMCWYEPLSLFWRRKFMSEICSMNLNALCIYISGGTRWRSWFRQCATSRKVAGSIPDDVIEIFHWHNPFGRIMAVGSTQPLTEMSTRNISWGVKAAGAYDWQPYHLHVSIVLKSGSLNLLEP
jgi:hypothetical protein